jgi:phospholipid/cholesterol/gamma-HCH transport system substrate-binding protein
MNRKQIFLLEVIFWLLIIFCGSFFFIYKTSIKDNIQNTYYIFFDDVEGLVTGSNVRLMGINIGHVKDVKIFDNRVFVSLIVTKENVKIPKCATATIEFYGLGGSTSLELNPATSSENDVCDEIIPSGTYRVQDYWDGSKLSSEVMISTYTNVKNAIDDSKILEHKDKLMQSKALENLIKDTQGINKEQTVVINKMTKETEAYFNNKIKEAKDEVKDSE